MKKLRNKQTGEIVGFMIHKYAGLSDDGNPVYEPFNGSIDEWEDAPEELKEYWYISDGGDVYGFSYYYLGSEIEEAHREISNLFESKEEAEQAVEKLKAWRRLRELGLFRWGSLNEVKVACGYRHYVGIERDFEIVFGGEE